jgi:hypothetical protein
MEKRKKPMAKGRENLDNVEPFLNRHSSLMGTVSNNAQYTITSHQKQREKDAAGVEPHRSPPPVPVPARLPSRSQDGAGRGERTGEIGYSRNSALSESRARRVDTRR